MDSEIAFHNSPNYRIYKSGRLERLTGETFIPPSLTPQNGVVSKDTIYSPEKNLSCRIYLPEKTSHDEKLPVLIYFHGGGFIIETPFSPTYHTFLTTTVSAAKCLAISVDYRRAPEFPIPIPYQDSWDALKWVFSHISGTGQEHWINKHAHFTKVYLAGDSAGANISHHLAIRAKTEKLESDVLGIVLIHPYFWGKTPIDELETRDEAKRKRIEGSWGIASPGSVNGVDDPLINVVGSGSVFGLGCGRVLVMVAGDDQFARRGLGYAVELEKSEWEGEVEVMVIENEGHIFHLKDPDSDNASRLVKRFAEFINKYLGLAYHFEEEIYETLEEGLEKIEEMMAGEDGLYTVSIIFCVFRSYGYNISSDVFRRFKGIDGNFRESLKGDAKGLLSLYEAAHLRTRTDCILEEALSFTSSHLESLAAGGTCPTHLLMRIRHALTLSQRWKMEIVAAVEYISSYEQEKDHDEMLLKFAKISFKILDDTFDRYVSLPEAESLANSLKRWAPDHAMDQQPDYLKFVFTFILDTFEEFRKELSPEGTPYSVKATIEEFKTLVKANFDLAKSARAAHLPSFEEYMEVGEVEVTVYVSLAATKGRLMNDIYGFEDDMSRGYFSNALNCYMKQYRVSKQEAVRELHIMVEDADKAINEELLTTIGVSRLVLKAAMGIA
ncbi:hypothetical protein AALP_AA8G220300 [Arabis alpina]|uniref:Alpha/beta hydrolase fold-3 domain-containing protein n=1 Tax=Arabis alpina TaxID=50452 RepID=A0A087G8N1_ARAAL|nr:hypothetical protein AALP_AA8G220300 [Arabis alpina]